MKLGEFDPPQDNPYLKLNLSVVQSPSHRELCTLTAIQSFVLLKNDGLLPLKTRFKSVAVSPIFYYFETVVSLKFFKIFTVIVLEVEQCDFIMQ